MDFEEPTGLYRVGGRNGQGKSTGFYIGMNALLGMIPALPLLQRNAESGFYEVTNGLGRFGFAIEGKKVTYYYQLNTGEQGNSSESVNNNYCLEVIRTMIGFELDLEFKTILNVLSGGELNFVVTGGRTDLAFLKDLIYSEEIERLQESTIQNIKELSNQLDRISYDIEYVDRERSNIKVLDSNKIQEKIEEVNYLEELVMGIEELSSNIKNITLGSLEGEISKSKVMYMDMLGLAEGLYEYRQANIRYEALNMLNLEPLLEDTRKGLVDHRKADLKHKKLTLNYDMETLPTETLRDYRNTLIEVKYLNYKLEDICTKQLIEGTTTYKKTILYNIANTNKELLLTLKNTKENYLNFNIDLLDYTKDNSYIFAREIINYKKLFLRNYSGHFRDLEHITSEKIDVLKKVQVYKEDLDGRIYKEGRCILCYSKRY